MHIQTMFDVKIFSWDAWDKQDEDLFTFYKVYFHLESFKKYDGCDVHLTRNGYMSIYDGNRDVIVWNGYLNTVHEFNKLAFATNIDE